MVIKYISTLDQLADIFTKGLPSPWFHALSYKLMGTPPLHLRGDVKNDGDSVNRDIKQSINNL